MIDLESLLADGGFKTCLFRTPELNLREALRGGMDDAAYAAFLERGKTTHPLGRVGQPAEIADLVAFLMSEQAGWITGETIAIDGGRHLTAAR